MINSENSAVRRCNEPAELHKILVEKKTQKELNSYGVLTLSGFFTPSCATLARGYQRLSPTETFYLLLTLSSYLLRSSKMWITPTKHSASRGITQSSSYLLRSSKMCTSVLNNLNPEKFICILFIFLYFCLI